MTPKRWPYPPPPPPPPTEQNIGRPNVQDKKKKRKMCSFPFFLLVLLIVTSDKCSYSNLIFAPFTVTSALCPLIVTYSSFPLLLSVLIFRYFWWVPLFYFTQSSPCSFLIEALFLLKSTHFPFVISAPTPFCCWINSHFHLW